MDLAFHPDFPDSLWVVNMGDNSTWIGSDAGRGGSNGTRRGGDGSGHFMAYPAAIAFGARGCTSTTMNTPSPDGSQGRCVATAQNTSDPTPFTNGAPGTFMGPTLWTADPERFDGGWWGHFDMLHNSPDGVGIAWDSENSYWIFDGFHSSITRYKFGSDHGPGGENHSDGVVARYAEGSVKRVDGVPSHMELDRETGLLYIADTGNNRIAILDTSTGSRGASTAPNFDQSQQYKMDGAEISTLVSGEDINVTQPAGLALHDGMIFITDAASGNVLALDMEGQVIDWLETELTNIRGLNFHESGDLFVVDGDGRVLRIQAKE
jgi:hypothetical protein